MVELPALIVPPVSTSSLPNVSAVDPVASKTAVAPAEALLPSTRRSPAVPKLVVPLGLATVRVPVEPSGLMVRDFVLTIVNGNPIVYVYVLDPERLGSMR